MAYTTTYDKRIADLSKALDDTRLYYGSDEAKARMKGKVMATEKLHASSSVAARARRGVFNVSLIDHPLPLLSAILPRPIGPGRSRRPRDPPSTKQVN